jgi:hypothetical protein
MIKFLKKDKNMSVKIYNSWDSDPYPYEISFKWIAQNHNDKWFMDSIYSMKSLFPSKKVFLDYCSSTYDEILEKE